MTAGFRGSSTSRSTSSRGTRGGGFARRRLLRSRQLLEQVFHPLVLQQLKAERFIRLQSSDQCPLLPGRKPASRQKTAPQPQDLGSAHRCAFLDARLFRSSAIHSRSPLRKSREAV